MTLGILLDNPGARPRDLRPQDMWGLPKLGGTLLGYIGVRKGILPYRGLFKGSPIFVNPYFVAEHAARSLGFMQ